MNKQSVCLLLIDMENRMINRNLTNVGRCKWTLRKLRHILKRKTFSMKSFGRISRYFLLWTRRAIIQLKISTHICFADREWTHWLHNIYSEWET